jgi:hypothetical protein
LSYDRLMSCERSTQPCNSAVQRHLQCTQSHTTTCFRPCSPVYLCSSLQHLLVTLKSAIRPPRPHLRPLASENPSRKIFREGVTMHIPPSSVAAGPATPASTFTISNGYGISKETGGRPENWSSLIGIITALVGNVLISFALNMQRYAHIRLDREWQEKERQRKKRNKSSTSLARLAEATARDSKRRYHSPRRNADSNGYSRGPVDGGYDASETDPLMPQSPSPSDARPSNNREDSDSSGQEEAYKQTSYLKSPYWWAGIILMTVGECGNFLAYGFAPASIVSPLGVVALISNCIIAPFMLKEPLESLSQLEVPSQSC